MDDFTLKLQKKTEILLNTIVYPMLKHFPQAEKFALCQEIKQAHYRILRNCALYKTAMQKEKMLYLKRIDAEIQYLKVLFNVARDQKYITEEEAWCLRFRLAELGGGLRRADAVLKLGPIGLLLFCLPLRGYNGARNWNNNNHNNYNNVPLRQGRG